MEYADQLEQAFDKASEQLLSRRTSDGHWTGTLSASALSTATAISALSLYRDSLKEDTTELDTLIRHAVQWLNRCRNTDGGWGDTDKSHSNISTTLLVKSALILSGNPPDAQIDAYIDRIGGFDAVRRRYGADLTFSVPILTNAALAGLVPWNEVPQLPFERAAMPRSMFRLLNLQVVSYAIPALVAIGQVRFHHFPAPGQILRNMLRARAVRPTLRLVRTMQPESGGFLEAAPLSSFVAMSLISCGQAGHPIVQNAIRFLRETVREDGSWPIDTNLATWGTSLSIHALGGQAFANDPLKNKLVDWLLSCRHRVRHSFTGAEPGGWGWTDLSGAVPDADDTPGAILALAELWPVIDDPNRRREILLAVKDGIRWLLRLRNADGGIPTFCRGWGVLPFDRSSTDLTAHTIRAFLAWKRESSPLDDPALLRQMDRAIGSMLRFLRRRQNPDGSWFPLWFGNQDHPEDENPCYGTAKVLRALGELGLEDPMVDRALDWIVRNRRENGRGGIEENAVILEALALFSDKNETVRTAYRKGIFELIEAVRSDRWTDPSPIGLYFAKLWYYEELYPLVFTTAALRAAHARRLLHT